MNFCPAFSTASLPALLCSGCHLSKALLKQLLSPSRTTSPEKNKVIRPPAVRGGSSKGRLLPAERDQQQVGAFIFFSTFQACACFKQKGTSRSGGTRWTCSVSSGIQQQPRGSPGHQSALGTRSRAGSSAPQEDASFRCPGSAPALSHHSCSSRRVWKCLVSPAQGCCFASFQARRAGAQPAASALPTLSCPFQLPGPSAAPNSEDFTHFGDCKPRLSASPAPCRAASSSSSVVETKRGSHRCS